MSDKSRQMTPEEAAEFTEQVFNKAREGDAAMMAALLTKGLPPNLRNHKGDTLLMLAAYHGHVDTVKVLLEHKADPEIRNDNGQSPIAGAQPFAERLGAILDETFTHHPVGEMRAGRRVTAVAQLLLDLPGAFKRPRHAFERQFAADFLGA